MIEKKAQAATEAIVGVPVGLLKGICKGLWGVAKKEGGPAASVIATKVKDGWNKLSETMEQAEAKAEKADDKPAS